MSDEPKDTESGRGRVMRFGPAPNVLGVVGAIIGGVAVAVFQARAGSPPSGQLFDILGGVVFGFGIGWLTGLIAAMGWLGE